MLPRRELLQGSRQAEALTPLLDLADTVLRTWEPSWSGFLAPDLREEAETRLASLSELRLRSAGGHPAAERRRLWLERSETAHGQPPQSAAADWEGEGLMGLEIAGNFLFDPATAEEFRAALVAAGAAEGEVGDLWLRGDRGAQAVVTTAAAAALAEREGQVRSVPVCFEARPLAELRPPPPRAPRRLSTVEASCRLDAVASAGFGLSRSRMAELIRQGAVRVDWQPVTSPSRELRAGERVQLRDRGELEVLEIEPSKRERLRIALERR
ncbi:MAG: photosystem II S4 domain protein [Cyanobium sp.]